jgi:hypothetical protein
MILDYLGQSRSETHSTIIATLKRKGWVERAAAPSVTSRQVAEWDGDEWVVRDLTTEELAAKNRKAWTPAEFLEKFTQDELVAMVEAARTDAVVELIKIKLTAHASLHNDALLLLQSLDILTAKGLLAAGRKAELLS